jgi:predicted DNA binding CopG/RHH family protein
MRARYDWSRSRKNPYVRKLKQQITIRLDKDTIAYFKQMAAQQDVPYQTLVNLYLADCAARRRKLKWA